MDGRARPAPPGRGRQAAGDQPEEHALARPVGAHHADPLAAHDRQVDVQEHGLLAEGHVRALQLQDPLTAAHAAAQRERHLAALEDRPLDLVHGVDAPLHVARALDVALVDHPVRPVLEAPDRLLHAGDLLLLGGVEDRLALQRHALLQRVGGVVAAPHPHGPALQLRDRADRLVQQPAVVGDRHHRALEVADELLQRARRRMSRCDSGSSRSSTSGARARQAASAASLRCPPLRTRVGSGCSSSLRPSARRWRRASPSARGPPSSSKRASRRCWRASTRPIRSMSACSAGSARSRSHAASSASSWASSGRAARTIASASRVLPLHELGEEGRHQATPGGHVPGVGVLAAREDPQERRLAAAVGPHQADTRAVGDLEVEVREDPPAAEGLRHAAGAEERDGRRHVR